MCQKQLFCSKADSALQQVNPPSTVISQTMVFKSRRTEIKFGKLYDLDAPGCLASVCTDQVVVMDMQNHRLVQFMNFDRCEIVSAQIIQKTKLVVLLCTKAHEFKLEIYECMNLKQYFEQSLADLLYSAEDDQIESIMKMIA